VNNLLPQIFPACGCIFAAFFKEMRYTKTARFTAATEENGPDQNSLSWRLSWL